MFFITNKAERRIFTSPPSQAKSVGQTDLGGTGAPNCHLEPEVFLTTAGSNAKISSAILRLLIFLAVLFSAFDARAQSHDPNKLARLIIIQSKDFAPIDIEFKMAGQWFRVPAEHIASGLQIDDNDPTEIRGINLVGAWPGFAPTSSSNLEVFRSIKPVNGQSLVRVALQPACRNVPEGHVPDRPCTARRAMEISFNVRGPGDSFFVGRDKFPEVSVPEMKGMKHLGFVFRGTPDGLPGEYDKAIYAGYDDDGFIEFARCMQRESGPSCQLYFSWLNLFNVTVSFDTGLITEWQMVREMVVAALEQMLVSQPGLPPHNGREVLTLPIPLSDWWLLQEKFDAHYRDNLK